MSSAAPARQPAPWAVKPSDKTPGRFIVTNEWGGWECAFDGPGAEARAKRIANAVNTANAAHDLVTAAKELGVICDAISAPYSNEEGKRLEAAWDKLDAAVVKAEGAL